VFNKIILIGKSILDANSLIFGVWGRKKEIHSQLLSSHIQTRPKLKGQKTSPLLIDETKWLAEY